MDATLQEVCIFPASGSVLALLCVSRSGLADAVGESPYNGWASIKVDARCRFPALHAADGKVRNRNRQIHVRFPRLVPLLLMAVAGVAVLAGGWQTGKRKHDPVMTPQVAARIAPVGGVYAGASGEAARAAAVAAAAERDEVEAVAAANVDATANGQSVYAALCSACHTRGVAGAPTLDKAAWEARITQGRETLYRHAIEGYSGGRGFMPPKGGNLGLSDEEVRASVDWMLDNLH